MATKLNMARDTRKNIRNAEQSIDDSIFISDIKDGIKKPGVVFNDKIFKTRDEARETIVQIKDVLGQLEKDSNKIQFYEDKKKKMEQFLIDTEWVCERTRRI